MSFADFVSGELQHFETIPRSQFVPDGQPVLLECQISAAALGDSLFEYSWTRNGKLATLNRLHHSLILARPQMYSPEGSTIVHRKMVATTTPMDLFIQEFRAARDSGSYVCTVTDSSTGARLATPAASLSLLSKSHKQMRCTA